MDAEGQRFADDGGMATDGLLGRHVECEVLDHILGDIREGLSRTLVLHGEPGIGKTALLGYFGAQAAGCRVISVVGVESEMELAYAALQQLCAPMLDGLASLPAPQRAALTTALGIGVGPVPDRLLLGLAVLALFADAAAERPLVLLVDDLQWVDESSVAVLAFVARRLAAESIALVMASRVLRPDTATLPTLEVRGIKPAEARALLDSALLGPLDAEVRDQLIAETRGNPLALLQLPQRLSVLELAGGFGLPVAERLSEAVEDSFRRAAESLPESSRRLLLLAAAEPRGDSALLWRAAARLGVPPDAAAPVMEAGLAEFGTRVRFRHPLVRSAVYNSAALTLRQQVHAVLGDVVDARSDPDRRAWHRARATAGPDDEVAEELERSAERASARGGLTAVAAFLERATALTADPGVRTRRALAAAEANLEAGGFQAATELITVVERGEPTAGDRARVDLIRAQLNYMTDRGRDSPALLLAAARRLESIDPVRSRATYLEAFSAGMFAGRFAEGCSRSDIARAARAFDRPRLGDTDDLLLDGFVALYLDGNASATTPLRRAVDAAADEAAPDIRSLWLAHVAAVQIWDDRGAEELALRRLMRARSSGALGGLPAALNSVIVWRTFSGVPAEVPALLQEFEAATGDTGGGLAPHGALIAAAFRGDRSEFSSLAATAKADVIRRGEGVGLTICEYAQAVVHNSEGDWPAAMATVRGAAETLEDIGASAWALGEFVEAAARCGAIDAAAHAVEKLSEMTGAAGTDWALGAEARARALVSDGDDADSRYQEAIERLERTTMHADLARTHLLYGEWLRRARRRTDARTHLRAAHERFDAMGMRAFTDRAARELKAAGSSTPKRVGTDSPDGLTPQEAQVAMMARDGLANIDIAARLFLSPRTVQYHLRKVFTKLGISSRTQLHRVLPDTGD
ncbi:LuxR family transcriptional regulator [Mycobacterium sp. EPG1]|nr:LuxR family transcriptional regulator [Mycobacterium sp. EPG1]